MAALGGVEGDILITSLPSVTITNDVLSNPLNDKKTYVEGTAAHRYWDPNHTLTVQTTPDGVTWTTVTTGFTIQYVNGTITFAVALTGGSPGCRLSTVNYFPYASIGNTTQWTWAGTKTMIDSTTHKGVGGSHWQDFTPLLKTGKVTLKKWFIDQTIVNHLTADDLLVFSLVTPSGNRYEGFSYLTGDTVNIPVNNLVAEQITFQLTSALYPI